jgi:hypothetical protein
MRTRDWRRYQEERVYINRLKTLVNGHWYFRNANGDRIFEPIWVDYIGVKCYFFYKSLTTTKRDSKYKNKYSSNKEPSYYREVKKGHLTFKLREKDKELVKKIIKDELTEYFNQ